MCNSSLYRTICGIALIGGASLLEPTLGWGQTPDSTARADTVVRVTFGAFVDSYYAWDFGRPPTVDRSFAGGTLFTTQPARHNEFNVNLAFLEAVLTGANVHGRLALQAGTSVQSNTSGEPSQGQVSGASLSRSIQEAFAGIKFAPTVWVDGGIFFSHMGMESWISRDNLTYTRSLVAEYSPYCSSGVRAVWTATPRLTAQLHVVNGWQNMSENNSGKGVGLRIDYAIRPTTSMSYYNFFSDEAGNRLRTFNGIGAKASFGPTTVLGQVDVGTQAHTAADGGTASWHGFTAIAGVRLHPAVALVGRVERYDDPDQVIIATGQRSGDAGPIANGPFQGNGASIGIDVIPIHRAMWRTEVRSVVNRTAIFPNGATGEPKRGNVLAVTSLGVTF